MRSLNGDARERLGPFEGEAFALVVPGRAVPGYDASETVNAVAECLAFRMCSARQNAHCSSAAPRSSTNTSSFVGNPGFSTSLSPSERRAPPSERRMHTNRFRPFPIFLRNAERPRRYLKLQKVLGAAFRP